MEKHNKIPSLCASDIPFQWIVANYKYYNQFIDNRCTSCTPVNIYSKFVGYHIHQFNSWTVSKYHDLNMFMFQIFNACWRIMWQFKRLLFSNISGYVPWNQSESRFYFNVLFLLLALNLSNMACNTHCNFKLYWSVQETHLRIFVLYPLMVLVYQNWR